MPGRSRRGRAPGRRRSRPERGGNWGEGARAEYSAEEADAGRRRSWIVSQAPVVRDGRLVVGVGARHAPGPGASLAAQGSRTSGSVMASRSKRSDEVRIEAPSRSARSRKVWIEPPSRSARSREPENRGAASPNDIPRARRSRRCLVREVRGGADRGTASTRSAGVAPVRGGAGTENPCDIRRWTSRPERSARVGGATGGSRNASDGPPDRRAVKSTTFSERHAHLSQPAAGRVGLGHDRCPHDRVGRGREDVTACSVVPHACGTTRADSDHGRSVLGLRLRGQGLTDGSALSVTQVHVECSGQIARQRGLVGWGRLPTNMLVECRESV